MRYLIAFFFLLRKEPSTSILAHSSGLQDRDASSILLLFHIYRRRSNAAECHPKAPNPDSKKIDF